MRLTFCACCCCDSEARGCGLERRPRKAGKNQSRTRARRREISCCCDRVGASLPSPRRPFPSLRTDSRGVEGRTCSGGWQGRSKEGRGRRGHEERRDWRRGQSSAGRTGSPPGPAPLPSFGRGSLVGTSGRARTGKRRDSDSVTSTCLTVTSNQHRTHQIDLNCLESLLKILVNYKYFVMYSVKIQSIWIYCL